MQVTKEMVSPTRCKLTVTADQALLDTVKHRVLQDLGRNLRLPGFRPGKAPLTVIEKNLDPSSLQTEFLQQAVNELYVQAVDEQRLRPVSQPEISISKFVPFTTLEVTAEIEMVGDIKLPDYKKVAVKRQPVTITEEQVEAVIKNLRSRSAERKAVKRAAASGDEVVIDFVGTDAKTKKPIAGADGQDYPLLLGSNSFIPGFEDNVVGLKAGESKDFALTFPKDYGVKSLQTKKVNFHVTVKTVNTIKEPKVDDAFAATVGPFKSVAELRADIRRELTEQQQQEVERQFENELLEKIAAKTEVAIPAALVDDEIDRIEQQERQNTAYRGQTWQEHLDEEGVSAEEHRDKNRPGAELRVKAGLILGEIADKEHISVSSEELEIRLQLLKGQYQDQAMLAELDKPENRRDIMNRLLTEKTLDKLKGFTA